MSIFEKPAWQMNLLLNKNRPAVPFFNKKKFLQNAISLLIVCHSLFQVNAPSSIFKSDWVNCNNKGIPGPNITMATLLPATICIGSNWKRNLLLEAGHSIGSVTRRKIPGLKRISS